MKTLSEIYPMHAYQKRAVEWMRQHETGYLAVDMGLGKTRIILEFFRRYHAAAMLVVAPLRVATQTWPEEIEKWAPELSYAVLHGKGKDNFFKEDKDIYIINYDGLRWLDNWFSNETRKRFLHGMLVLDEATMIKSSRAARFRYLHKMRVIFSRAYALSATPAPNGYHDLWSQYFLLDFGHTLGTRKTVFMNRYFITLESRRIVPINKEIIKEIPKLCARSTFRLDAKDYLQLPDVINNDIFITLPPELNEQYKQLEKNFYIALSEETTVTAVNAALLSMKLRQFCQGGLYTDDKKGLKMIHSLKIDTLERIISELQGAPTLVAIQFRFEVSLIRTVFPKVPCIYGGTTAAESRKIIDKWNSGKIPILVCHPMAISHGVNLQHGGHYVTWLSLPWSLEQYQQFNGRLHRQGQKNHVILNRVLIRGSIEERIAGVLSQKDVNQRLLLDTLKSMSDEFLAKA